MSLVSNGKAFFHSFQTCNLIGRSKDVRDDAMLTQGDNTMEIFYKWSRKFQSDSLERKISFLSERSICIPTF